MSTIEFDIIEYMSGLTGYVFDKAVLNRIAFDRNINEITDLSELTQKDKDLVLADELLVAYQSPDVWASSQQSHGSYKSNVGSQTINASTRRQLYNQIYGIYKKYNDPKLENLVDNGGSIKFLDL